MVDLEKQRPRRLSCSAPTFSTPNALSSSSQNRVCAPLFISHHSLFLCISLISSVLFSRRHHHHHHCAFFPSISQRSTMAKQQSSGFAARAWSFLRFAFLWSRKSSIFRRRLILNLRLMPNYFKNLRSSGSNFNGEREFSIEETPIFRLKFHKNVKKQGLFPRIPCINGPIEVEGEDFFFDHGSYHFDEQDIDDDGNEVVDQGSGSSGGKKGTSFRGEDGSWREEEVDLKADEFIAEFYRQMKLQRQISYLQYKEMLDRGAGQ